MIDLNKVYMTSGVNEACRRDSQFAQDIVDCLTAYALHDWGVTCQHDWEMNDQALETKNQIVAKYNTHINDIFIITDPGSEVTTVLFCSEY